MYYCAKEQEVPLNYQLYFASCFMLIHVQLRLPAERAQAKPSYNLK